MLMQRKKGCNDEINLLDQRGQKRKGLGSRPTELAIEGLLQSELIELLYFEIILLTYL